MAGILDNKSRVIDTIITDEGRKQLADGGINIRYVSFTDGAAFYKADVETGAADATQRFYLEASQQPQDDINFRADDDGNVLPFRNSDSVSFASGRILSYSFAPLTGSILTGSSQNVTIVSGSTFVDNVEDALGSSFRNLQKLYIIATNDPHFDDDGFALGPDEVMFTVSNDRPIPERSQHVAHIDSIDSIFSDPRFSNHQNFKFLPPVNKFIDESIDRSDHRQTNKFHLGNYQAWGRTHVDGLSYSQLDFELGYYRDLGYEQVINFDPTSNDNRLVGQFFERGSNFLRKLDIIDFGVHSTGNSTRPLAHVFFVGKVEVDSKGTDTFIHLFTLIFD